MGHLVELVTLLFEFLQSVLFGLGFFFVTRFLLGDARHDARFDFHRPESGIGHGTAVEFPMRQNDCQPANETFNVASFTKSISTF